MTRGPEDDPLEITRTDLRSNDGSEIQKQTRHIFSELVGRVANKFGCRQDAGENLGDEAGGLFDAWWKAKVLKNVAEVEKTLVEVEKGKAEIERIYSERSKEAATTRKLLAEADLTEEQARKTKTEREELILTSAERRLAPLLEEMRAKYGYAALAIIDDHLVALVGAELRAIALPLNDHPASGEDSLGAGRS